MRTIVEAKELSCFYGIVLGLNNVSFNIEEGITGLVGPNGAGKSTLMRLMTGQIQPSAGSLSVFGEKPWNNPSVLSKIGYCPESERTHKELRPLDWLRSLAALGGVPWKDTRRVSEKALEAVRLPRKHWKKAVGKYSKGMKQRVKLAQAIMLNPDLIILDEPMNGLDPMGRSEIASILKEQRAQGVSVLISSHILGELESLCSRFVMMNWGRVMAAGQQSEIRSDITDWSDQVSVRCDDPRALVEYLQSKERLKGFMIEEERLYLWLSDPERFFGRWMDLFAESPVEVYELVNEGRSLSSLFQRVTK